MKAGGFSLRVLSFNTRPFVLHFQTIPLIHSLYSQQHIHKHQTCVSDLVLQSSRHLKVVLWEGESRAVCCVLGQTCPDTHRPLPQMRERFDWRYHSHSSKSLTHIQTSREETEEKRREEKRREEKRREEKRREEKRREEKRREEKRRIIGYWKDAY